MQGALIAVNSGAQNKGSPAVSGQIISGANTGAGSADAMQTRSYKRLFNTEPYGKGYLARTWDRFIETNKIIWGPAAPTGMTLATGGAVASALGEKSTLQLVKDSILSGKIPARSAVIGTAKAMTVNIAVVNVGFEVGVLIQSAASEFPIYNSNQTVGGYWNNIIWGRPE